MFLAAYVLVATAVDRLIAVWKAIFYSQKSIPVRATVTSGLVWLVWAMISLPNLFIFDVEVRKGIAKSPIFHQKNRSTNIPLLSYRKSEQKLLVRVHQATCFLTKEAG